MGKTTIIGHERLQRAIQARFNPIASLTPEVLTSQLEQYRVGHLRQMALTMEAIEERDLVLKAVAAKRKKAPSHLDWEIVTRKGAPPEIAARHAAALEYFYDSLESVQALNENNMGGFDHLRRHMMDSVGKGYACFEILWRPDPEAELRYQVGESKTAAAAAAERTNQPSEAFEVMRGGLSAQFRFTPLWFFENRTHQLRFLETDYALEGAPLKRGQWLTVCNDDRLMVGSSICYMFKSMSLLDWLNFNEKFGIPGLLALTDALPDTPEWSQVKQAVADFMNDFGGVLNRGTDFKILETAKTGDKPFKPLVDLMERAYAIGWRGGDLSTISKGEGVGSNPQEEETGDLLKDDVAILNEALNFQVDPVVTWKLFREAPQAYVRIKTPQDDQSDRDIKVTQHLVSAGARLSVAAEVERFGRTQAEEGEEVITRAAPRPAGFQPADRDDDRAEDDDDDEPSTKNQEPGEAGLANESQPALALLAALSEDLAPVRERLARILTINDPEIFERRLKALIAELPELLRDLDADPAAAQPLVDLMRQSMAAGLTQSPAST